MFPWWMKDPIINFVDYHLELTVYLLLKARFVFLSLQEDFYAVVDWAYKIDPLRCISMHGITERYLSGQKADAAGFVRLLLGDLESRVSMQFSRVCLFILMV